MADPYTQLLSTWQTRRQQAVAQGISEETVNQVAQMDLKRVAEGGQALSKSEAAAELQSAHTQRLATGPPPPHHTGIMGILANIPADIGNIGAGLGAVIAHPSRLVRQAEKDPLSLLPGVTTGRAILHGDWAQLEQHPVGTALDVAAVIAPMAKLARIGAVGEDIANAGEVLQKAALTEVQPSRLGKLAGQTEAAKFVTGSPEEALAQGRVIRAAARGLDKVTKGKLGDLKLGPTPLRDLTSKLQLKTSQARWVGKFHDFIAGRFNTSMDDTAAVMDRIKNHDLWGELAPGKPRSGTELQPFPEPGHEAEIAPAGMSARQSYIQEVVNRVGDEPHLLTTLAPDEQKMVRGALFSHGTVKLYQELAKAGLVIPADERWDAMIHDLPKPLQDRFAAQFEMPDPHTDPYLNRTFAEHFKQPGHEGDAFAGLAMHKDIHNLLYGKHGLLAALDPEGPGIGTVLGQKSMRVFKGSLMLRPTMVMHIAMGQLMFMAGDDPSMFLPSRIAKARKLVTEDHPAVQAGGYGQWTGEQAHGFLASSKAGEMLKKIPDATHRMADAVTKMGRAMVYITKHDQAVASGLSEVAARQAGMTGIRDVLHTFDGMTPFERTVMKQVFPFYGFSRHVFDYVAKFPADHPFRAEVFSKLGEQQAADMRSGLPAKLQQLLWLGGTDSKGNVKTFDVSALNPFRSFTNDFTLGGLASQINPIGRVLLEHFGVKGGTPDLYPTLTVNPQTGSLEAVRPQAGGILGAAEAFVPQLSTLDAILGFNTRLQSLRQTDPSAYRQLLFSQAGIPIPRTVNVYQQMAREQGNVFKVASQDVSAALKSGDFSYVRGYPLVPYKGRLITPDELQRIFHMFAQLKRQPGVTTKAIIPKSLKLP